MKRLITVALLACASTAFAQSTPAAPAAPAATASPAKKELVAKLLQLQQPGLENLAKAITQRPIAQLTQQAGAMLQQLPPDKREATAKSMQADVQKFVEEAVPLIRDRAMKLAPTTIGPVLEEKFSEDELRQLVAWHESPLKKKYEQSSGEMENALMQKLSAEIVPVLDPKLAALRDKLGATLRQAAGGANAGRPPASGARPPARPASK
jgi:hypothetical protein